MYVYDVVVKKFTFAVSSRDELLGFFLSRSEICIHVIFSDISFMAIFAEVTKNERIIFSDVIYCRLQLVIGLFISQ